MERIPFALTINASNIGTLNLFANKWKFYSDHRRKTWIKNFIPVYQTYLYGKYKLLNRQSN